MVFQMFGIILETSRGILNSLICVVDFSNNFNSVFHKKGSKNYWCSSNIAYQEERTYWILKTFTFNEKNPLYLPIILTLQFFEGESDQGVTQLVIKLFDISQISRVVSLR